MPVLRGVKAEKNDNVCLPKDGKVVEVKSVFGTYEYSEMLSHLKALALNHCEPGVSCDSIRPLWDQTLQVRKLMALSDTEFPRRKRKLQQFLKDKFKSATELVSEASNQQNVSKLSKGQISHASSASCMVNMTDFVESLHERILLNSHSSGSLLTSEDNFQRQLLSSEFPILDNAKDGGPSNKNIFLFVDTDGSVNGSNPITPEHMTLQESTSLDLDHSSDSLNLEESKSEPLKTPRRSMRLLNFIGDHLQRMAIPIGPRFQADVPEWSGSPNKVYANGRDRDSDSSRWLGTQVWPIEGQNVKTTARAVEKQRPNSCSCVSHGSIDCVKRHILEERLILQSELGPVFFNWKFGSSFIMNQQTSPTSPPHSLTLSVVSRIKNNYSGLLNSISNGSSAGRKVSVPSGAIAAVFHNSMPLSFQDAHQRKNSLEHMLVYTPSVYVIQHELLPSIRVEPSEAGSKTRRGSYLHSQDEDLRVKVGPVQWWDVCWRLDSPEREECILLTTSDGQEIAEVVDNYKTDDSIGGKKLVKSDLVKPYERSHRFLSSAEVQINSGRLPIWQKSKIHFYVMSPEGVEGHVCGAFEIEKVSCQMVEVKRKDLLPVFEHIHNIQSSWDGREVSGRRYCNSSSLDPQQARDNGTAEIVICHSKPASISSIESSDGEVDIPTNEQEKPIATPSSEKQPEDIGLYFQEGYCKLLEFDGYKSTEVLTDAVDSNAGPGHYKREKS